MRNFNLLSRFENWMESLSSRIRPVSVSYPGSQSLALVTERQARDDREMKERQNATARVYQGYTKGIRFAATILVLLFIGVGSAWGVEEVIYTLKPASGSNNSYSSNCDVTISDITWNITGNSTTQPWRIGGKSLSNVDRAVYSKTAMGSAVTKVELTVGAASSITVNTLTLIVASDAEFKTVIDEVSETFAASSTITFAPTSPATQWATGAYYKFVFNVSVSGKNNKFVEFNEAKFYAEESSDDPGSSEPAVSLEPSSVSVGATDVETQSVTLGTSNFSGSISSVTTGLYSNEGCTFAISSNDAWVKNITVNNEKTEVSFTVDDNTGAARQCWLKITASDGSKSAYAVLPISQAKYSAPTGTFAKYTGNLVEGDYVICDGTNAMKNTVTSKPRLEFASVTVSNEKITNPDEGLVWKVEALSGNDADYFTIYNEAVEKYAAFTSGDGEGTLLESATDYAKWQLNSDKDFVNKGKAGKVLRKNGTYGFASYGTSTGNTLTLYKKALPTHAVTFTEAPAGGTVAVSAGSAINSGAQVEEGATVTITPTPSAYYRIASVTKGGQAVTPVQGVYSFTMPASDVAIVVTFELIPVTSVTLNKSALELVEGATETLSVTSVLPNTARNTVTWSSSNTDVATVTDEGVVTAVAAGNATIKATSTVTTSVFGSCAVTVTAPSGNAVTIDESDYGNVTGNVSLLDILSGVEVVLTAHPNAGYSVDEWQVEGLPSDPVISNDMLTCTFTMPDNAVSVNVAYVHEVATLKLVELGVENTYDSENTHYWKESVTLPGLAGLGCKDKVFVGWDENADCSTEPTYKEGDEYEIPNVGENKLYAVFVSQTGGGSTNVVFNAENYASAHSWANGTAYNAEIDGISFTYGGGGNNGKYYTSDHSWRFYDGGSLTISGAGITGVTSTPSCEFEESAGTYSCNFESTIKITSITVAVTTPAVLGDDYTTSCTAQLPILAAPTFSVEAGTYYEGKSITLIATNNADIYYTLDGSEPTTNSTKFVSTISLSARGTTTIKAIAVKDGFEDSEIATATYTINLPFATVGDLFSYLEENSLTSLNDAIVTGVISGVTEVSTSYGNATYFISNDGTTTAQLQVFRGKYVGNVAVSDENKDKFVAGNKVTVRGNIETSSNTLRFAQNNYMTELTEKVLSSVTVGGTASKTAYSEEDNQFSFAGLTATANYSNTGYSKDVTNEVTWKANEEETYTVTEGGDVNVTATLSDVTSDPKVVAVTFTTKTVESISLSYDAITTYVGHSFLKPTVTASYVEDIDDEDVTELATFGEDAYNGAAAGTYPIAVSYKGQDASYTITVKAIANDQATAYTAAEINDIIANCYKSTSESSYDVYVKGIVVEDAYNKSGNSVYYISADGTTTNQFYIYNAKYFDTETSATGNVKAGDDVIVKGKIQNYNSATPELKSSTVVYQLREAEFAVANVAELEVGQADLTASDLEVSKDGNGEVTLVSNDESKATIVDGKIHAVGAGDVTITANLAATANEGSINYKANSTTFTVHVIAARTRYTVTFDADGGTGTDPIIANQLAEATVELPAANPYSKENNKFMGWQVLYNEIVLEKALGESFTMPATNVTIKPKWEEVATCAISFMVNDAEVFSANAPQTEEYSLATATHPTVSGFTFLGWSETEVSDEVEELPTMITSYTPEAGKATKVLYGIYRRVEEGANYGKYEKATAVAEGDYLIVCEDQSVVFNGSLTTLDATSNTQAATISDGVLTLANADNYVFTIAAMTGGYSIKSASNKYIGNTGTKNGLSATADEILNQVSISNGNAVITSGSTNYLKYNKTSGQERFRYFTSNSQESIQLYKKNLGTTYYTSSPVEKVTITFNANGGEGGCEKAVINKGSQLTICAEAPTKLHSEFAGWKNSENVYVAGQAYTFNESLTLTAQWNEAATYAVTYSANGASGAVPTIDAQYAGDAFDVAAKGALAKSGYDFQGWKYNGKLYAAGASFTMPASAVEFVAQWKKQNISTETMTLVTSESQLADGSKVVIANNKGTQQYLAGQLSSKYLIAENTNVTFNGNEVTYSNANVTEWTLVKAENGWQLMNGENYLGAENDELTVGTTNATVWTITISNGEVAITSGDYTIRYNYNSGSTPRFKTYGSNSKLALPQLYASVTAVTENASISDLGYVEGDVIVVNSGTELTMDEPSSPASITVKEGATVTVSAETHANNITVENGATIEVGATTAANNLVIQTTSGSTENQGKSGQLTGSVMPVVSGDLFIEIKLCEGAMDAEASRKWYCISAPFNVNMNGGFFWGDGTQMVLNTDFQLFEWDGDRRATGISGWKRVSGVMKAGIAYFIGFDDERSNQNIIKLKATNKTISNKSSINAPEHSSSVDDKYANWNGLANPNFRHIALNKDVQAFDHNIQAYTTYGTGDYNFVVGTPFFIKETGDITIEAADNSSFRAPKREVEQLSYCVRIVREGKAGFDNQMYVRASEEASASYEEGHDLVTMNAETSNYGALLWTVNYGGKRLAIEEAPLVNDKASYALSFYAPADGAYRIETPTVYEDASLYLTYEGNIIWDLSAGAYELELNKGATEGYGLMLVRKAPQVTTGMETIDNSQSTIHNCQKVILNDHVYILRDGQLYDVTGKAVK